MPPRRTKRQQYQSNLDQLIKIIESEDIAGYGGDVDGEGFLLWGSQRYFQFMSDPPSIEELLERKTDGRDDLGLDLHYIDEDENIVYLVQSKFRSQSANIQRPEFDSFLNLPNKLVDSATLSSINNNSVLQFALRFKDAIANGFDLRLVYMTTETSTNPIRSSAESWSNNDLILSQNQMLAHHAEIVDVDELLKGYFNTQRIATTNMKFMEWYISDSNPSELRSMIGRLSADELKRVFLQHGYAMFRRNPRGPLGSNNVNKEIRRTLEDPIERGRFYLLNNGLTAVCEAFSVIDGEDKTVSVRDLQIVNGCQTTWNIVEHAKRGGSLEDVSLSMKLVEAPEADTISTNISQASNSQSQMKDWDFLFNENEQIALQSQFERLDEPFFYELKRGEQKYIVGTRQRKTTIKDVAQAMWAFIGYPSEAKDRLREIPRLYKNANSAYHEVFFEGVTAKHLLLPLEIHNRVKREWKKYVDARRDNTSQNYQDPGDARLHIVWLIGRMIARATDKPTYRDMDLNTLDHITKRIDEWFPDAYAFAKDATDDTAYYFTRDNAPESLTLRQVFRSTTCYSRFKTELDRVLRGRFDELQRKIIGLTPSEESEGQLRL